ncbi:MAG: phage portal protein [Clostridia bacterium]
MRTSRKKFVKIVDLYRSSGMTSYELSGTNLIQREKEIPYVSIKGKSYNWKKLPVVPIKANAMEIPLISRVKQLQDALNLILSDFMNNMEENVRNSIIVLKNYDGTDLGEFRKNLSSYGAIKTRTQEGASGGVDVLKIEVNAENYKTIYDMIVKAITQNSRGFDSLDDKSSTTQNQLSVMSMYSDIDLDANDMETEIQVAFSEMRYFFDAYLAMVKSFDCNGKTLEVIFNRDILINETELIENCINSMSILSKETIVAKHPWVNDVQKELEKTENLKNTFSN